MEDGNSSFICANKLETNSHTNQAECVDSVVGPLPSQSQAVTGVPEVARARALVLLQGVPAQLALTRTTAEQAADRDAAIARLKIVIEQQTGSEKWVSVSIFAGLCSVGNLFSELF